MNFLVAALTKELRLRARDPWSALLWLGIPLMLGSLFTMLMRGGAPPTAQLLLVDEDGSFVSSALASALSAGPVADIIDVQDVARAEGEQLIDAGKASALLLVPAGFGAAVLADEPVTLTLRTNPSQTILPAIVEETLGIIGDGVFYAHRLVGGPIAAISTAVSSGAQLNPAQMADLGESFGQTAQNLGGWLLPPALQVEALAEPANESRPEMAFLFFPGVLVMALLLTAQGLSSDFWEERERGTLRRFVATPQGLGAYVGAKFAAAAIVFGVVEAVMLAAGTWWHGIRLAALPVAWVWLIVSGLLLFGLLVLLQLLAPTRKSGGLVSGIIIFPLMMIGGSFFPFEAMPEWLAAIGRWSPNGAMVEQLKLYLLNQPGSLASGFAALSAVTAVLFALIVLRHRSFARGA